MHQRPITKYLPGLERLEEKQLLSAGPSTRPSRALSPVHGPWTPTRPTPRVLQGPLAVFRRRDTGQEVEAPDTPAKKPTTGYLVYRITNPNRFNNGLNPPFSQVLVQSRQPVPGQVYNVSLSSRGTGRRRHSMRAAGFT